MKKFVVSGLLISVFAIYAARQKFGGRDDVRVVQPPGLSSTTDTTAALPASTSNTSADNSQTSTSSGSSGSNSPKPTPTPSPTPTPTPTPAPKPAGQYKDGTYTGSVEDAFYGLVQVKAVVSGGKLTDVVWLQYPNDRSTSREINSQADPWLTQEAIAAQSSNVNIISGATDSSMAFRASLHTALSAAL